MKLSIVIPTYNEEKYLPRLLASIKKQKFKDYEVIVADANSKDRTREIAKRYGCKVVKGGNPAEGRNNGAKHAKGEYILFLDSDLVLTDNYLVTAIKEFEEKELGIAINQVMPFYDKKTDEHEKIDKFLHNFANFFVRSTEDIKPHGAGCNGILTKRALHKEVRGFDELMDFGEDTDYLERVGAISEFKVLRNAKLFLSTRRLEKEGRKELAMKYIKSTLYQFAGKKITAANLGYTFGYENKKRILYAVCGEGMGHAIRSSVIINHLKNKYGVMVVSSDRAYKYLSNKFDNVYNIEGFNIVYKNNEVKNTRTFLKAMKGLPKDMKNNMKVLHRLIKEFKPNIILSDFEAYSNIIAKVMRIPLISVDNQHVMSKCKIKVPKKYTSSKLAARSVIRTFIVMPKRYLVTTFFYPQAKNKERVLLFPPVLRDEILDTKPSTGNHIFVYQTSKTYEKLIPELKKINKKFVIYGLNKEGKDGNLTFRKFNEDIFLKEFASCKAVITNGGFTLIGEALYFKKPILSVPVRKQFEQILNAIYLDKLGYGEYHKDLNKKIIEEFLFKLGKYRKNLEKYKREDNSRILKEIDNLIERYSKKY
jgi:uncharacterized protein (TIGR00661 family)